MSDNAELYRGQEKVMQLFAELYEAKDKIAELETRLAAAERDAERYRGLRDGSYLDGFVDPVHPCDESKRQELIDAHSDMLIRCDAARGATEERMHHYSSEDVERWRQP